MSNLGNYNLSKNDGLVYIPYSKLGGLKRYELNRNFNGVKLMKLRAAFNKYKEYNAPVIINDLGYIIDGQHRVDIAEEAGKGVYAIVVSNKGK